jgi:hypothetical protein
MTRKILCVAFLIFAIPFSLQGARLQLTLPQGLTAAHLLSGGTQTMIDYEKGKVQTAIAKLKGDYQIDAAETGTKKGSAAAKSAQQAYQEKIAALRRHYNSLLNVRILSSRAEINLSSSAMAEVSYVFTARNGTDRIVTDISYRPLINGRPLSTSSAFVLEFMDPSTMKSGLGPGETMTNQGHEPEKFSFFTGEVTQDEIKSMQKDFDRKFGIEVLDMHFTNQKDYKGQFKPLTFEEAFASALAPLSAAARQAKARARELDETDAKALKEFKARRDGLTAQEAGTLAGLKKAAVRYTAAPDKKGRCTFEDVAPGTYFIYAGNGNGMAVFEPIKVGDERKIKRSITQTKKDPFVP